MKKLKLFISLWFTMFSMVVFGQAEYEKIAITQNTQDNTAGRLLVQDVTTGEVRWILKSILDNKFNQPTGDATQYLDGAGNPTTFPVLSQSDRVITEVRNSTGATITKGTVVYLNGATGGKPNVQKAQANAEATSSGTFGVIQSDINNNSNGYVVVIGTVLGLNTSAYTAGQVLWLSPTTAGGFTTTKPVAPNHAVYVGIVTLAATQGTIEVKIQNGYELDEIHDVLITSKTDNDGLIYESASGLWKNKQITKAMVGLANVDNTSDLNKPISTATQTALNLKENTANKNTANGYAGLGSDGKLISSQLPAITITDTFVVGSQAAMLALTAETGDVAVRTDVNKSFILKGSSAGTLADWQELLTPTSSVTSVFGRQGAVTANNGDYTTALVTETTNKRYQTDIQQTYNDATSSIQTQLNSKANDNAVVHLAGSESVTGAKTFTATPSFDNNIFLKHLSSWSSPAGYTVIGGRTDGFLLSASSTKTALIGLGNLTQAWTYDFPNKAGTFAMTSDVPTISGTTNYVSKFTGASTLGNSQIFDNGTNVGIGVTGPNAKLEVGGNAIFNSGLNSTDGIKVISSLSSSLFTGGIEFQRTTVSGGSKIQPVRDASLGGVGMNFLVTQDNAAESSATYSNAMTILPNKNVGVGTATPGYKLEVSGTTDGVIGIRNSTNNSFRGLSFLDGSGATEYSYIKYNANTGEMRYWANPTSFGGFTSFYSNGTESMRIASNGNVGIGTQNPEGKLNVYTGASVTNATAFNAGDGSNSVKYIPYTSAGAYNDLSVVGGGLLLGNINSKLAIGTWNGTGIQFGPTNTLISGKVGIGTSSPTQSLDVRSSQSTPTTGFGIRTWDQVPPQIYLQSNTQSIGAGGGIGFGSKDPSSTDYLTWRIRSAFSAQGSGFGANQGLLFDTTTDGTSSSNMINALTLLANGNATFGGSVTATGFFQSSDLRLKDIISRDGDVIKYKWKDKRDDKIHIGYVAQEVQKENPDQVNADDKGILSVNYIEILVDKIRKLEKEIELLKSK